MEVELDKLGHVTRPIGVTLLASVSGGDTVAELPPLTLRAGNLGSLPGGVHGRVLRWHHSALALIRCVSLLVVAKEDRRPMSRRLSSLEFGVTEETPSSCPIQVR
jgi:hypothetical protein